MKPCRAFKKRIALAIVGGDNDPGLTEHLADCAACRVYADEMRAISAEHIERANQLPKAEAPLRLRTGFANTLRERQQRPLTLHWRWITAGAAATALAILVYLHSSPSKTAPKTTTVSKSPEIETAAAAIREPSYAAYHRRLSRSPEELEVALSRYEPIAGPSSEPFTALSLADLP
ncbi:MAG TPA: hypothetical protein VK615_17400 [Candidatus Binatia bacterium]|nr:hypothetical protein [Candidatus Binatia bacterium]